MNKKRERRKDTSRAGGDGSSGDRGVNSDGHTIHCDSLSTCHVECCGIIHKRGSFNNNKYNNNFIIIKKTYNKIPLDQRTVLSVQF